jgi:hypothetical protein
MSSGSKIFMADAQGQRLPYPDQLMHPRNVLIILIFIEQHKFPSYSRIQFSVVLINAKNVADIVIRKHDRHLEIIDIHVCPYAFANQCNVIHV